MRRAAALLPLVVLLGACVQALFPDPNAAIRMALHDLEQAGLEFDADVYFRRDPIVVCDGFSCAELRLERGRRWVLVSRDAFVTDAQLRASLIDVWGHYQRPRPPTFGDQARSALRILEKGPDAGIHDVAFLRRVHHRYRQLRGQVPPDERGDLPEADAVPYP